MWPKYRLLLDEMVANGQSPKYYRENQPWATVIFMAATDENWWIKRFVSVCNQHPNDAIQAAQTAAMIHSGYLPSMQGDHLEDFISGPGADYLPGPYSSRQEPPWLETTNRKHS